MGRLGLIGAGIFVTDPVFGYPPGTPGNVQTLHGTIHICCGVFCFSVLAATMFVLARRFAGDPRWKGWTISTIAAGILVIVFFVVYLAASVFNALPHGTLADAPVGLFQCLAINIGWGWVVLILYPLRPHSESANLLLPDCLLPDPLACGLLAPPQALCRVQPERMFVGVPPTQPAMAGHFRKRYPRRPRPLEDMYPKLVLPYAVPVLAWS